MLGVEERAYVLARGDDVEAGKEFVVSPCNDSFCCGHCFVKEVALGKCLECVSLKEGDKGICSVG